MSAPKQRNVVIALSSIMSIRMLGLFMILPVFSVYAAQIPHATTTLIGIALGIYGLTQACLQIPFGMLSDHIGRKPVIFAGLCLLLIGSVVAAFSHSIYFLILGRALQGAGAIGSTVLALLADLTPENERGKAMAFIGLSIGCAFMIAMIAGPTINHYFHLSGIFFVTAAFSLIAMLLVSTVPTPKHLDNIHVEKKRFSEVIRNAQLLKLDAGIFSLHLILTALFVAMPILLTHEMHLSETHQILLYLCVLIISFVLAVPFIVFAEKKQKMKPVFVSAVFFIAIVQMGFYFCYQHVTAAICLLLIFFTAFTLLEALLPSLVSKTVPPKNKGAAMGIYSSSQFLGIFIGGTLGGLTYAHAHAHGVFALCATIGLMWFLISCTQFKSHKNT